MASKIDFGKMQQTIYTFVIDKLIPKETSTGLRADAVFTARETDQFWVSEFDELYQDLTRDKSDYDDVMDSLEQATEAVRDSIANWYGNAWNFGPGEPTAQIKELPIISDKEFKQLINTFDPSFEARARAAEKVRKAGRVAKDKADAILFKPRIPELLALITQHDAAGWTKLHKLINKNKREYEEMEGYFKLVLKRQPNYVANVKKIMKAKDGAALKKLCKKYLPARIYAECVVENLYFVKNTLLTAVRYSSTLSKMIAKDVQAI